MNENFVPSRDQRDLIADPDIFDNVPGERTDPMINLRAIWSAVYRDRFLIAAVIALAVVIAIVATLLMRPIFRATASVQIEQSTAKVLESEDTPQIQMNDEDRFLQTQVDILKSRALALRVAGALGLDRNDNFVNEMGETPTTKTLGVLDLPASKREQVLRLLTDNMTVDLPRNSRIAGISFASPNPRLAARVANSYADNFITANLQRRYETSAYARNFLENRLRDTRDRLQDSERAAIGYARSARLIDASNAATNNPNTDNSVQSGPRSLTVSRLVMLSSAYTDAQTQRVAAQEHWEQAQRTPLLSLVEVLSNPAIQQLMQQRAQLVASYQEERQRRKADYPTMMQSAAQIAEFDRQIDKLANGVKNTIKSAYLTSLEQEHALLSDVSSMQAATLTEQDRSIRYNILRRDVDTNRALYDGLLQRYKEVSAEAGIATNNISVIDNADPPAKPVSPRPLLNVLIAIILGGAAAALVVLAREKFDDAIRTPDDIPTKLGQPSLAAIPLLTEGSIYDILKDPRSPISEAYQALRVSLDLSTPTGLPESLLFTSSRPSEGKTTTTYAVARDFARVGRKVIVIDGDLRKPSMHHLLGRNNDIGLATMLVGRSTIDQAVQTTDQPNLDFIACGPLPPNPAELLASATLPRLLHDLAGRYELVIIDGPPVLGLADSAQLANVVGGTVFVVEAGGAHYGNAKTAIRRLQASRAHLLGVVLTKFDAKKSGYGYGYGYNYSYSYSYGGSKHID